VLLAKYDTSGNAIWAKLGYGAGSDIGFSVANDSNSNVYFVGRFQGSTIQFPNTLINNLSPSTMDGFVGKFDRFGNELWVRNIYGNGSSYPISITTINQSSQLIKSKSRWQISLNLKLFKLNGTRKMTFINQYCAYNQRNIKRKTLRNTTQFPFATNNRLCQRRIVQRLR
jgi:hypothetical protein